MAAPNLIGATTITGKIGGITLTTTSATSVLSNAASSGKCLKVNTLNACNYGTEPASITVGYYTQASAGGSLFSIVRGIVVPAGSTLNVIDKSSQYYLEENTSIGATSTVANIIDITYSYEEIS
jgi:hypothetical protein